MISWRLSVLFGTTAKPRRSYTLAAKIAPFRAAAVTVGARKNPLQEKRLSVESVIEKDIILSGDADKLERVFDNLLRNAVNYSYPDTVIHLLMKRMTKEHKVLIRVQNHGRTIAKEKLEHIFEQFFRVDASRSSATGGSGLGLAIARQIVEMHYGQIRAESADETIVFEVELPCE